MFLYSMDTQKSMNKVRKNISKIFFDMINDDSSDDDTNNNTNNNKTCLITHERLEKDCIKLLCNHEFNYLPILYEVTKQKLYKSNYSSLSLTPSQMQCPYCRNIQNRILPLLRDVEKIYGVNYPDKYTLKPNICSYQFISGKRKGNTCDKECHGTYCKQHDRYITAAPVQHKCTAVIKCGPRKGDTCNANSKGNEYCKRHTKI